MNSRLFMASAYSPQPSAMYRGPRNRYSVPGTFMTVDGFFVERWDKSDHNATCPFSQEANSVLTSGKSQYVVHRFPITSEKACRGVRMGDPHCYANNDFLILRYVQDLFHDVRIMHCRGQINGPETFLNCRITNCGADGA